MPNLKLIAVLACCVALVVHNVAQMLRGGDFRLLPWMITLGFGLSWAVTRALESADTDDGADGGATRRRTYGAVRRWFGDRAWKERVVQEAPVIGLEVINDGEGFLLFKATEEQATTLATRFHADIRVVDEHQRRVRV